MNLHGRLHKKDKRFQGPDRGLSSFWPAWCGAKTIKILTRSHQTCSGKSIPVWAVCGETGNFCFSPSFAVPNEEKALWFHVVLRTCCMVTVTQPRRYFETRSWALHHEIIRFTAQWGTRRAHTRQEKGIACERRGSRLFLEPLLFLHASYCLTICSY